MQFHEIKKPKNRPAKRRVGRGGKRGTYSGRGLKGQKSRSGFRLRPEWRDTLKRMPKQRGYQFSPVSEKPKVVNLGALNKKFKDGELVNLIRLKQAGLVLVKKSKKTVVKILGSGNLTKKLTLQGLLVSETAAQKIKKAGGKVVE